MKRAVTSYLHLEEKLLRKFDKNAAQLHKDFDTYFPSLGHSDYSTITAAIREQYKKVIPQIPYIGKPSYRYAQVLLSSAKYIAMAKVLIPLNISKHELGKYLYEDGTKSFGKIPNFLKRVMGFLGSTRFFLKLAQKGANTSLKKKYNGDWVTEFIPGQKGEYLYKMNVVECGIVKFFQAQDVPWLAKYVCLQDWKFWNELHVDMHREKTIAGDGNCCDFTCKGLGKPAYNGWTPEELPEWPVV